MRYRIEKDNLGEKTIAQEAYYGIATDRSKEAFQLTKHGLSRQMIKALTLVQKVICKTNCKMNLIDKKYAEALQLSCDEILNGKLHGQFIVDVIHDGYGYGMYNNVIEVITNRANEMLGSKKGLYAPLTCECVSQYENINEVNILVGKAALVKLTKKLVAECKKTYNTIYSLLEKNKSHFDDAIYKQLESIVEILERDTKRIDKALPSVLKVSYGANIPSDIKKEYLKTFIEVLNSEVTEKYVLSDNYFTQSTNLDCFMYISTLVKDLMVNFSRSITNLNKYILSNNASIESIQDVPVQQFKLLLSFVKQVSFYIVGNDSTVSRAVEEGELDDNFYLPIIYASLHESINLVRRTIRICKEKIFETMVIN